MTLAPGAASPRGFAVALTLVVGPFLGIACTTARPEADAHQFEGVRNGVVLVFNPASCSAHAGIFPWLARVDSIPGVTVIGIMTVSPTPDELDQIKREYGIDFELRTIAASPGIDQSIQAIGLHGPLAWVVRKGKVESVLGMTTLERIGPDLPFLFSERP